MERFLYRLSKTRWSDVLVVKGAAMLRVWDGAVARPTRDIDFLGRIDSAPESIEAMIRECLDVAATDGLEFSTDVAIEPITIEDRYPGARAVIRGTLAGARIALRLDIGVTDVAVPAPGWVDYPALLEMESPRILAYHPSTAVAEKFQTMIEKGLLNSRVKDYYDIWMLSRTMRFEGAELLGAIRATFEQRGTDAPHTRPDVLGDKYASQAATRAQWATFIKKLRASGIEAPADFGVVIERVSQFIMPPATAAAMHETFDPVWEPEHGWSAW
jgi:predicted nucleotidyltransferase component of viral defense system